MNNCILQLNLNCEDKFSNQSGIIAMIEWMKGIGSFYTPYYYSRNTVAKKQKRRYTWIYNLQSIQCLSVTTTPTLTDWQLKPCAFSSGVEFHKRIGRDHPESEPWSVENLGQFQLCRTILGSQTYVWQRFYKFDAGRLRTHRWRLHESKRGCEIADLTSYRFMMHHSPKKEQQRSTTQVTAKHRPVLHQKGAGLSKNLFIQLFILHNKFLGGIIGVTTFRGGHVVDKGLIRPIGSLQASPEWCRLMI